MTGKNCRFYVGVECLHRRINCLVMEEIRVWLLFFFLLLYGLVLNRRVNFLYIYVKIADLTFRLTYFP